MIKFKMKSAVVLLLSVVILLTGCQKNSINQKPTLKGAETSTNSSPHKKASSEPTLLVKSGIPAVLPWENDQEFLAVQEKVDARILMASFCTVLKDPLPGEESNVHLGAQYLKGTVVAPGEIFSQNRKIGPYSWGRGFRMGPAYLGSSVKTCVGGGVCKIASTLYNVTVLSNLPIIERYPHRMPVPYVPYGQDATVSFGVKDYKFKNTTNAPLLIWAQGVDNRLYMAFYGQSQPPQVEWHHQWLRTYQTRKVYRANYQLPKGEERVVVEGMDGGVIKSWVTLTQANGTSMIKQLGKSYYDPLPYLIEVGK
ncbi:MAG: VanW family protein [Methylocystaceae bacterium]